ncbi:hypothetical protein NGA_0477000, partial [Nannochloropsis gaditana CCMP526]|uniref:uncharacterized protein n=1 Tax=Nannochloropsis gaditana (strain CCMP526) TaxID=1093141 RepID=UPI00029F72A0
MKKGAHPIHGRDARGASESQSRSAQDEEDNAASSSSLRASSSRTEFHEDESLIRSSRQRSTVSSSSSSKDSDSDDRYDSSSLESEGRAPRKEKETSGRPLSENSARSPGQGSPCLSTAQEGGGKRGSGEEAKQGVRSLQGREGKGRDVMQEEVSSRDEGERTSGKSEERARTLAAAAVPASSRAIEEAVQWEHRKVLQERQKELLYYERLLTEQQQLLKAMSAPLFSPPSPSTSPLSAPGPPRRPTPPQGERPPAADKQPSHGSISPSQEIKAMYPQERYVRQDQKQSKKQKQEQQELEQEGQEQEDEKQPKTTISPQQRYMLQERKQQPKKKQQKKKQQQRQHEQEQDEQERLSRKQPKQAEQAEKNKKERQDAKGTGQELGKYQALRKDLKREITACNQELHLLKLVSGARTEEHVASGRERAALLRRRLHKVQEQLVSLST